MTNAAASHEQGALSLSTPRRRFAWADPLSLVAVAVGCLVLFDSPSFLGHVHGDSLQLAFTTWDLSTHDYAWEGLHFSRVPSLVPDFAIFGSTQLLTGSWRLAYLVFGTLSLLGLGLAAGWIIDSLTGCGWRTGSRTFLLLALPLLFLELPLTLASRHTEILVPNLHSGPLVLAFCALCVVRACVERASLGKSLLIFILATAGILSDPLFAIAFTLPVLAVTAYRFLHGALMRRTALFILVPAVAGVGAGELLDLLLQREPVPGIDLGKLPQHAWAFLRSPVDLMGMAPLAVFFGFVLPIALFFCFPLARPLPGDRMRSSDAPRFWWFIAATTLLAVIATTALVYEDLGSYRYTMPLQWWPIVFTAALIVRALGRHGPGMVSIGLGGLAAALAAFYSWPGVHAPAILGLHHPAEACLMEAQRAGALKAGLGDYWTSRYIEASSDWRLQVDQIRSSGEAYYFDNDRFWFTHDIHDDRRLPAYNFIVMTGLNEPRIRARYGTPDRTLDCGGTAIWVYDDAEAVRRVLAENSPVLYDSFLAADRGIDVICVPADRFASAFHDPWPGRLAPLERQLEVKVDSPNEAQPRTWGPFFALPAGRWKIALDYSLSSDAPGRDRWEISAGSGSRILYEAPLGLTDGGEHATVGAELDLKQPANDIEIRSFLAGTGSIVIHGAEIARAGAAGAGRCAT